MLHNDDLIRLRRGFFYDRFFAGEHFLLFTFRCLSVC